MLFNSYIAEGDDGSNRRLFVTVPLFGDESFSKTVGNGAYLRLLVVEDFKKDRYWIYLSVHDHDDYNIGQEYPCTKENYQRIAHEIINWMIDNTFRFVDKFDPFCGFDFFPYVD